MYFKVGQPSPLGMPFAGHRTPLPSLPSTDTIPENDIVLVQKKTDPSAKKILSKPLRPGKRLNTGLGHIDHESIIGQAPRAILSTESGKGAYRIYRPTLGEYTNLTSRIVTPVSVLHIPFVKQEIWRLT
jgi:tRNA A58 N-methylase Trm61